jgi:hypothetical protein
MSHFDKDKKKKKLAKVIPTTEESKETPHKPRKGVANKSSH